MSNAQAAPLTTASQRAAHQHRPSLELPAYGLPPEAITPESPATHYLEMPATGSPAPICSLALPEWWRASSLGYFNQQRAKGKPAGSLATYQRSLLRVALSPQAP